VTASRLLAHRYARALFLAATAARETDRAGEQLQYVLEVLEQVPQLREILGGIIVPRSRQKELLKKLFGDKLLAHVLNLLYLLLDERRMGLLREIARQYDIMADEARGIVRVEVVAARPLSAEAREMLQQGLERKLNRRVKLEETVEPALIGGVQVKVGDTLYDGSVRGQLERMRQRMAVGVS